MERAVSRRRCRVRDEPFSQSERRWGWGCIRLPVRRTQNRGGSKHRWLPVKGYQDLILVFDDADSEVYFTHRWCRRRARGRSGQVAASYTGQALAGLLAGG